MRLESLPGLQGPFWVEFGLALNGTKDSIRVHSDTTKESGYHCGVQPLIFFQYRIVEV